MPKVYRVMKKAENDRPVVGTASMELGVRLVDVAANPPGEAHPGNGGMSVQPSLQALAQRKYSRLIPNRLQDTNPLFRGATGRNDYCIWTMGTGPFADAAVTARLNLRCDKPGGNGYVDHGVVEPAMKMTLDDFQKALADTRSQWSVEEQ